MIGAMPAVEYQNLPISKEAPILPDGKTEADVLDAVLGGETLDTEKGRTRMKRVHLWWDGEGTTRAGYKLPVGRLVEGTPTAVWRQVQAAAAAVNGARGGVDISDADKRAVWASVMRYYDKAGVEPDERPTFKGDELEGEVAFSELELDASAGLPTEFRILKAGENLAIKKGDEILLMFDALARNAVQERLDKRGNRPIPFDFGHRMVKPLSERSEDDDRAVGWLTPEIRGGELWATNVEFGSEATKRLKNREFRYFSPVLGLDVSKDGIVRPTNLQNVALTNLPGLQDAQPLVASDEDGTMDESKKITLTLDEFSALQGAKDENVKLAARVVELEERETVRAKEAEAAKVESYIAELTSVGKLPPAQQEWARGLSLSELEEFALRAPVMAPPVAKPPKADSPETIELSDEEKAVAKVMGTPLDKVRETKRLALAEAE